MDPTFVSTGKRLGLHPDSEQAVFEMPVWRRHAAYHDMCRKVYAMVNPEASAPETVLAKQGVDIVRGTLTPYGEHIDPEIAAAVIGHEYAFTRGDAVFGKLILTRRDPAQKPNAINDFAVDFQNSPI